MGGAYGRAAVQLLRQGPWLVWLLPALGFASVLWSQARSETLRFTLEFAITIACAVLAARLLKPRTLLVALTVALMATSAVSLLFGRQTIDGLTGAAVFAGVFGSKNQLGFFASLMLLASIALLIDRGQPVRFRVMGLAAALLSIPLLVTSRSATSIGSVVIAAAALLLGLPLSRLDRYGRARLLFVIFVVMFLPLLMFAISPDGEGLILRVMNRDATFTGRTILWRYAAQIIPANPLLGRGFNAFWLHDNPDAEALWATFRLPGRTGFTFHNTLVEAAVELGYVGAFLTVVVVLGTLVGTIRWSWQSKSVSATFFVAVTCCLILRSFAEVDILSPFDMGPFMLTVAATYAALKPREASH